MGRRGYSAEFRQRVLDLVAAGRKVTDVARDLGISDQIIYVWRRQEEIDRGARAVAVLDADAALRCSPRDAAGAGDHARGAFHWSRCVHARLRDVLDHVPLGPVPQALQEVQGRVRGGSHGDSVPETGLLAGGARRGILLIGDCSKIKMRFTQWPLFPPQLSG